MLLEVFKVMLRPLLEYCSVIVHPMLSKSLCSDIERQQKTALRTIYGFELSYDELLAKSGLFSLEERRKKAFNEFASKISGSDRFKHLFPQNDIVATELRSRKKYKETFARTDRLYKSPLYSMRRSLNGVPD